MPRSSSGGSYPPDWNEIADRVKKEANGCCVRCGHPHDPSSGFSLTVHHLDMNPANCEWWNLAALCQRCHLSVQARVVIERPWMFTHSDWFKPYVAGYYAYRLGRSTDRAYVIANMEDLILTGTFGPV